MYSNGCSEVMLGKAIKELKLPREELVILTKVFFPIAPRFDMNVNPQTAAEHGIINQHGLNRKVRPLSPPMPSPRVPTLEGARILMLCVCSTSLTRSRRAWSACSSTTSTSCSATASTTPRPSRRRSVAPACP